MQVNLKTYHALSLTFSTKLRLSDETINQIRETSEINRQGDCVFETLYNGHIAYCVVTKYRGKDATQYEVSFTYEISQRRRTRKDIPSIARLIEILSSMPERYDFNCGVGFDFKRNLKPKSLLPLPFRYSEWPDMPFDRIQGYHLVKLANNKIKYNVFLDAPAPMTLIMNILFDVPFTFNDELADNILKEALTISKRFVYLDSQ